MKRRWVVLFIAMFVVGASGQGAEDGTPADKAKAAALVKQLGDDSFATREKASEELLKLGRAAEGAVRKGAEVGDREVSSRCKALLPQIQKVRRDAMVKLFQDDAKGKAGTTLPGWDRFTSLVSKDEVARSYYATLFAAQADLLEVAEDRLDLIKAEFSKRSERLRLRAVTSGKDAALPSEVCALLTLGTDPRLKIEESTCKQLLDGLETVAERTAVMKEILAEPMTRKCLAGFLQKRAAPLALERSLQVARALRLPETGSWAAQVAVDRKQSGSARGWAILVVGSSGNKDALGLMKDLFKDANVVGERKLVGTMLRAEIRDVALAVSAVARGDDLVTYGFPYPKALPGLKVVPAPACYGFATEPQRTAAFAKWAAGPEKK